MSSALLTQQPIIGLAEIDIGVGIVVEVLMNDAHGVLDR